MSRSARVTSPTPTRTKRKTNAELAAELQAANEELTLLRANGGDAAKAVDEYKERVKKRALEAKNQHGWCDEVDEILVELGIDTTNPRFRFTVMVPVTIEADLKNAASELPQSKEDLAKFLASCVNQSAIQAALEEHGQQYNNDEDALLSNDWDTYQGAIEDWILKVGDITIQDIEAVTT